MAKHDEVIPDTTGQWNSEAILERGEWRAQATEPAGHPATPEVLAWAPRESVARRVRRAASAPILVGIAVFVAAVVVAIVATILQARGGVISETVAATHPVESVGEAGAFGSQSKDGVRPGPGRSADGPVFAHLVGEVAQPGVVELAAGARVTDALEAAGGPTAEAQLTGVNLARLVVDGEQIFVPNEADATSAGALLDIPGVGTNSTDSTETGQVRINSAGAAELERLPRVGPALAERILQWRETNGAFGDVEQLLEVPGIGAKTLDGFRDQVAL